MEPEEHNTDDYTGIDDENEELNGFLLTPVDVDGFNTPATLGALPGDILTKLGEAAVYFTRSYRIDQTLYSNVYITSDLHADLGTLDFMLLNAGIVQRGPYSPELGISFETHRVCNTEWIATDTIVMIIGDIVDGRRDSNTFEIPDIKGNIELLLHAYLYNLRIKANSLELRSELRFTIGNHDLRTVIFPELPLDFYNAYVHTTAKAFFQTRGERRACLLPFYNCCPYVVLTLSDEIACIHGGFTVSNGVAGLQDTTDDSILIQTIIDGAPEKLQALTPAQIDFLAQGIGPSPLWSRWYATATEATVCTHLNKAENPYKTIVVGHCQTGNPSGYSCCSFGAQSHGRAILNRPENMEHGGLKANGVTREFPSCLMGGCVLTSCNDPDGAPKIAFVDIAASRTFNPTRSFVTRAELLYLHHNPYLEDNRYYNVIERRNVGLDGTPNQIVWTADVPLGSPMQMMPGGGRKKTYRRRRIYRSKRRSKVRRRKTMGRKRARTYRPKRGL